jgi:beta-mannanase
MKKNTLFIFIIFLFSFDACCQAVASSPVVYHVQVDGSDCNPGTAGSPFRTIGYAAELMNPGDSCIVGGGEYHETVVPARSGTETLPITFISAEGEKVTVSGASPVTGWIHHDGNIWKAGMEWSLGRNNQVFYNGQMLHEARWPSRNGDDIMVPEGAFISRADTMGITCDYFPGSFAETDWAGTITWVMANSKWTSWSRPVEGYDANKKKITFRVPDFSAGKMSPAFPRDSYLGDHGDEFYLANNFAFLDHPGEWFFNEDEKMLYLIPPDGTDPNNNLVTAKKRVTAFDLEGKSFIHVTGIDIHASTINMENAGYCSISNMRARYISHSRGGNTSYYLGEKTGINVTGTGNVIRDSEIAFSVEHGIFLGGTSNSVINCHIHNINYYGCYGTPVRVTGYKNMVSHCTIHESGRDGIQSSGLAHLIKHNRVFNVGRIAHDLGMFYTVGNDGGGTEIRHNVFHDNLSEGLQFGLYLDNFTSNYVCHHNIVWGVNANALNFNRPSEYNIMANNTAYGDLHNWGRWETDGMFGDLVLNNLMTGHIRPHDDYHLAGNITGDILPHPDSMLKLHGASNSNGSVSEFAIQHPGIDKGIFIPGITGQYSGNAPDAGALETGFAPWKAGHDFENPPSPVYKLTDTPLKNRIYNACFELSSFTVTPDGDKLIGWERTDLGNADVITFSGPGGIMTNPDTRDTYNGNGLKLSGDGTDGIRQVVSGLEPNSTYVLAGWLKTRDAGEIRIGVRKHGKPEQSAQVTSQAWEHASFEFTTGPENTTAEIFIIKNGSGTAFADNIGLVPSFKWIKKEVIDKKREEVLGLLSDAGNSNKIITGQNLGDGLAHINTNYNNLIVDLEKQTGEFVAIAGIDYEYAKRHTPEELKQINHWLIDHWNKGGLVTISWHSWSPFNTGNCRNRNDVNLTDLLDPLTPSHETWRENLDRIADALQHLHDNGVIVIWRPLHEMNGNFFWWGYQDKEGFINLWRDMYDYFTNEKGLDNLIWSYSANRFIDPTWSKEVMHYYPGNDYVDIVGIDVYDNDLHTIISKKDYNDLISTGKTFTISEAGPNTSTTDGQFDNLKYLRIKENYPKVAYFLTWHDWRDVTISIISNSNADELMNHPRTIKISNLGK